MFAIVDIEGTGGSPKTGRIMEIAIIVHNGKRVIEEFTTLINPEQQIDPFVVALTGISNEMVDDAPTFASIANKIFELTNNRILVAHNSKFDYGFLKQEFKRLGTRFQRKNLCTVNMSRKLLPGHQSYSLGKLCQDLNIPLKNRHRALGDASATAILLEKLLFNDKKALLEDVLKDELNESNTPLNIEKLVIDQLPEETGVYYFFNEKEQPIYIGKSKNIRDRVISHFNADILSKRFQKLKKDVFSIDFQLTGSELIAEILESGEIKRFMPEHNRAQRRKKYRYAIQISTDEQGYERLAVDLIHPDRVEVLKFTRRTLADRALKSIVDKNDLSQEQRINLNADEYNLLVQKAIENYSFRSPNFLIIEEGKAIFTKSIVLVLNGRYYGFGFLDTDLVEEGNMELIIDSIKQDVHSPDKEQIIRKYLRKKKKSFQVVRF